ncbi:MAG: hypothetical protein AMJ53_17680 [Gammaproteobacteria bacterium SG8_11]|nr:MAG: hypothetical protein AMJ53_17680 [Gammaproteobacteria bacterium SG8_11]
MIRILWVLISVSFVLVACADQSVQQASASYKKNHDYASLERIVAHLNKGMKREKVENLLGEPDYSPTEGQYYYSSDRREAIEGTDQGTREVSVGLVVEYRDKNENLTNELQEFQLGAIGE